MSPDVALHWVREALLLTLLVAAPLLGSALAVGLAVSLFQALTSIQEMTLSSIPKMVVIAMVLLLLSPWMLQMLTDFSVEVFQSIATVSD